MELFLYVFALIAALLVDPTKGTNCTANRCTARGLQNPLCKFPMPIPSPKCGNVFAAGLDEDEKTEILETYTNLRWYVSQGLELAGNPGPQPAAEDMEILTWDDELAEIAQRWVNQCEYTLAECVDVDRFSVGQSIGRFTTRGKMLEQKPSNVIKLFYQSVTDMSRDEVAQYSESNKSDPYTQLVWGETNRIGCGKIKYRGWDGLLTYFMMCLYGPTGNTLGKPVYRVADAVETKQTVQ